MRESSVLGAHALGAHHEAARAVDRGAHHARSGLLGHRDRLARHHRLVDRRGALEHDAVDRDLLARPHAQPVADLHAGELHVLFGSVFPSRRADLAASPRSCLIAALVRERARSSSTWPSRISATITAAASK
jgi:hypothetical protein